MDDLSIFLAVFRENGFRAAAKRLGLSPSTVSERISALESGLGVPLLVRTTRSVVATAAGRELAERMSPLLGEMRAVFEDVASSLQDLRGVLKLNVTGAVMVDILPPLIDRFLARYPQVRIEIMVEDRLVDVTAAGCDAGIRYGEHLAQDTIAVPIGPRSQQLALAAAPSYLASRGTPSHPGELMNHDCIRLRYSSGAMVNWDFVKNGETVSIDPPGRLVIGVDGVAAAINLARSGRGIIATFENWLHPHFQSGDLEPVLDEWWDTFEGPWLYFSSRFMSAPLRVFVDFIGQERE
ncbi:LysR family transcriptional regulator [Pseudomonas petrae]|uniref:LysR family transcriptional regulator n=1 Tax=Pseudomonas petrae TaxID=2912190 RepID=A0ABS9I0H0_9PSED|nr:LysR family transcriptional regulator [Pseudomonas petrae]MCF7535098.1 LysR family transcriptional regulator [Pseudomonas petrae]MCF7539794.1 LysR family transcriptional regulator [Pseudomonas petrae]MCF7541298.1 LysR family transcriptional regulator [Pseudomonas petrae]MCF7558369.1 LysR family transcriptional regulator [Pseudomonas petrae]